MIKTTKAYAVVKDNKLGRTGIIGRMAIYDSEEGAEIYVDRHGGEYLAPVLIIDPSRVEKIIEQIKEVDGDYFLSEFEKIVKIIRSELEAA